MEESKRRRFFRVKSVGDEVVITMGKEEMDLYYALAEKAGHTCVATFIVNVILPEGIDRLSKKHEMRKDDERHLAEAVEMFYDPEERKEQVARCRLAIVSSGLPFTTLVRVGLGRVVDEVDSTGSLRAMPYINPPLSPKLERRLSELDTVLELVPGHGFAEALMAEALENLMQGEFSDIFDAWELDSPPETYQRLSELVRKWLTEDRKPPIEPQPLSTWVTLSEGREAA